jgi:two-component system sensor histidine kinase CpxA
MKSLFLKIFIGFGVAMVLINVASFVTGILTERRFQPPRNHPLAPMMAVFAQTAADTFERDGTTGLRAYLDRVAQTSSIEALLFNGNGQELSSRTALPNAQQLASRTTRDNPTAIDPPFPTPGPPTAPTLIAHSVNSENGGRYVLVGKLPRVGPGLPPRIGEPRSFWFGFRILLRTLLPLLLIGGLFCYLLARYLAKPIVQLRHTTQELTEGNFTARVDERLLKRRDEIGYLGHDFNQMASHIESLVEAQKRLLADISHELRSPLARQGVALGLARRKGNLEVVPALERISREADRMNQMIGQLLDLSRVENGTERLATSQIDLKRLLHEIVEDADYEARDRNRDVQLGQCDECTIVGVADLLRSAIENVVRNALRHTSEGTTVDVTLQCAEQNIIAVKDHGAGVPEKALSEIFQPFYRVEDARDRKTGGTGLGLAIAARAVRLHGGSITARNASDGGLVVEIRLPLQD